MAWLTPEVYCAPHSVQKVCVPSEGEDNLKTVNKTPVYQKSAPKVLYEAPIPTHIFHQNTGVCPAWWGSPQRTSL